MNNMIGRGICLWLTLLCWGATESWATGTKARPASNRRTAQPAKPAPKSSGKTVVADPCVPSASTQQTTAAPAEPARSSTSALAGLVTRARSQESAATSDPNSSRPLALDLWSSRVSAPDSREDVEASLTLQRLIHQVHALTSNDRSPAPPVAAPQSTEPIAEPSTLATARQKTTEPAQATPATPAAPESTVALSSKAQKSLEDLRRNPSRVRDPLEVAELLFLSGRPTDAVPFYEEALRHTRAGEAASGGDRAWVLFQLGNCLHTTDPAKAQDAYTKLISEYPNSPWTEMARASTQLLTWYQSARPDQLTAARKP